MVEQLGELRRLAEDPPKRQLEQVRLRMGQGFLHLGWALLESKCPAGLAADACVIWNDELRQQAEPMLLQARSYLGPIDAARLPAAERPVLASALDQLADLQDIPADPPGLPDEPPPSQEYIVHSLVWADAVFRTHRDGLGQEVRDRDWFGDRAGHLGEALVVRVMGRNNAFYEVEVAEVEAWRHCVDAPPTDDAFRLRFFVGPGDLALVTTDPFSMEGEDGTSIALRPGVPWQGGDARPGRWPRPRSAAAPRPGEPTRRGRKLRCTGGRAGPEAGSRSVRRERGGRCPR